MISYALTVAANIDGDEPNIVDESPTSKDRDKWFQAMQDEVDSLIKNKTWELVSKPKDKRLWDLNGSLRGKMELGLNNQDIKIG